MQNLTKRMSVWAAVVAAILAIPLVAMQLNADVQWSPSDFIFAGVLLFGVALVYELLSMRSGKVAYRGAVGIGLFTALALVWINGAVGIIGSEENPANLLYGAVLAVGFLGAIISGLKPRGMSYTLFAAALVQMLVPVAALIIWRPDFDPGVVQVFALNSFFAVLFLGSGLLFRQAARKVE